MLAISLFCLTIKQNCLYDLTLNIKLIFTLNIYKFFATIPQTVYDSNVSKVNPKTVITLNNCMRYTDNLYLVPQHIMTSLSEFPCLIILIDYKSIKMIGEFCFSKVH